MHEKNNNNISNYDDEIDLIKLFNILLQGKWIILSVTVFISTVAVIYSLLLPNIYESKALLVPVNSSSGINGALKSYSGIAGLAGVKLPSIEDEGNSVQAFAKLQSLSFFEENILPKIYLPDLMALSSWDYKTNQLNYNENLYNAASNTWVRDYIFPKKQIPSAQESFKVFNNKHFQLSEDKNTGFITLAIKHQSPIIAKEWLDMIISEINLFYREKDKLESTKSISYLYKQIEITNLSEIKQTISQILQQETKKLALIEAKKNYVFDYIDHPVVMENKSEPKRALIVIISSLLGGIFGIFLVLIRHYVFNKKTFEL